MKTKVLLTIFLVFLIKILFINKIFEIDYDNFINGGYDLFLFLLDLFIVIIATIILFFLLGKVKNESCSNKKGLIWAVLLCSLLFFSFQFSVSLFQHVLYEPRYEVMIVEGSTEDTNSFEKIEKTYPDRVTDVATLTKSEYTRELGSSDLIPPMELRISSFLNIQALKVVMLV
jgi:phosphoglycerol transferase MdoB-like AlkP superfamily enzyme